MAFKIVADLQNSVSGILSGTNLNNVTNLFVAFERAERTMANRIDVPEASGRQNYMLYGGVYDYLAPTQIFGGAVNDLRPQGIARQPWDYDYKVPISQFDQTKAYLPNGYMLTFEYDEGVGIMRVATPNIIPQVLIDPMNATTGWDVSGSASGIAQDISVYYQQPASLRFLLTGADTGALVKNLTNSLNLSTYQGVGVAFLAILIPPGTDPTTLTSCSLLLGSSATDVDLVTVTQGFLGAWTAGNFLLVAFDFANITQTQGTPDWSAISYVAVGFETTDTIINMRVGYLFISLPRNHELLFQTPAIFKSSGVVSDSIVDNQTEIILNPASYVIYEHECAKTVAMQMSGGVYTAQITGIDQILNGVRARNGALVRPGLYDEYESDNPSQELRTVGSYYEAGQG